MERNMKDTLLEINKLASEALESDGEIFLSEDKVLDLTTEALAAGGGTHLEQLALEEIQGLARTAVEWGGPFPEADVLTATELGLGR
jgi:hypothetical protein